MLRQQLHKTNCRMRVAELHCAVGIRACPQPQPGCLRRTADAGTPRLLSFPSVWGICWWSPWKLLEISCLWCCLQEGPILILEIDKCVSWCDFTCFPQLLFYPLHSEIDCSEVGRPAGETVMTGELNYWLLYVGKMFFKFCTPEMFSWE